MAVHVLYKFLFFFLAVLRKKEQRDLLRFADFRQRERRQLFLFLLSIQDITGFKFELRVGY